MHRECLPIDAQAECLLVSSPICRSRETPQEKRFRDCQASLQIRQLSKRSSQDPLPTTTDSEKTLKSFKRICANKVSKKEYDELKANFKIAEKLRKVSERCFKNLDILFDMHHAGCRDPTSRWALQDLKDNLKKKTDENDALNNELEDTKDKLKETKDKLKECEKHVLLTTHGMRKLTNLLDPVQLLA